MQALYIMSFTFSIESQTWSSKPEQTSFHNHVVAIISNMNVCGLNSFAETKKINENRIHLKCVQDKSSSLDSVNSVFYYDRLYKQYQTGIFFLFLLSLVHSRPFSCQICPSLLQRAAGNSLLPTLFLVYKVSHLVSKNIFAQLSDLFPISPKQTLISDWVPCKPKPCC